MTTYKLRCKKCNYNYTPKTNRTPHNCPNCGKGNSLIKEEEHLAEIIEID